MSTGLSVRLLTGPTKSGKTSLAATFAEWVFRRHKKVTRLCTADGGGYGTKMERLIRLGIVQSFRLRTRVGPGMEGLMEETCSLASAGWWPAEFSSVERGEVLPGVRMLPPVTTQWTMTCANGHLVATVDRQTQLTPRQCSICKTAVTLQTGKVTKETKISEHMLNVGAYVFEGITSISTWQLSALADRRARLELHGEKSNIGRFISGDMPFDSNNRADYGMAQTNIEKWLYASTAIPGLVESPLWTGLETQVEETGRALPMYAPAIAGQARSGQVPQWVGDWLGAVMLRDEKGKVERRLYLAPYLESDGTPHNYSSRAEPGMLPEFLVDSAGESAFSNFSLAVYLDMVAGASAKSFEEAKKEFAEAPGLAGAKTAGGEMPEKPKEAEKGVVGQVVAGPAASVAAVVPLALPKAGPTLLPKAGAGGLGPSRAGSLPPPKGVGAAPSGAMPELKK